MKVEGSNSGSSNSGGGGSHGWMHDGTSMPPPPPTGPGGAGGGGGSSQLAAEDGGDAPSPKEDDQQQQHDHHHHHGMMMMYPAGGGDPQHHGGYYHPSSSSSYHHQQQQQHHHPSHHHDPSTSYSLATYSGHHHQGYGNMYGHPQHGPMHSSDRGHPGMMEEYHHPSHHHHYSHDVENGGPSPSIVSASGTMGSENRPSPDGMDMGAGQSNGGPFPPPPLSHSDYQQHHHGGGVSSSEYPMTSSSGAGNGMAPSAPHESSYGYQHHPSSSSSSQYYYGGYQHHPGGSSGSVSSSRPSSQQSMEMPSSSHQGYPSRPESTGPSSYQGMGGGMNGPTGYYHHPSSAPPSHGYQYSQYQHSMPSSGYPQYHPQGHMASYPHSQYQQYRDGSSFPPHSHGFYYHPGGSVTPSSQMAGVSFGDPPFGGKRMHGHHHYPHHHHHHAQLSKSFSSELDDSSRNSSPSSGIPAPPPHKLHQGGAPLSAPAKIRVPIATRPLDHPRADELGPLRESSQRLNALNQASSMDSVEQEAVSTSDPTGTKPLPSSGGASETNPGTRKVRENKATTSIHDASLLLGLRTSCSGSPATLPTVTDDTLMNDQSDDDEDATLGGGSIHHMASEGTEDFVPYIPKCYPTRLARAQDRSMLNSLHCYIRSNLLEVFVVEKTKVSTPNLSPSTSLGRVGLRCVYCAEVRKRTGGISNNEAPMAVFYPKAVKDIYRMVTSWQRCHLRKCRNLPPTVRAEWNEMREHDKSRGKTVFWLTSARDIGLVDCQSRAGGVRFARPSSLAAASGKTSAPAQAVDASYFVASSVPTPAARDRNDGVAGAS